MEKRHGNNFVKSFNKKYSLTSNIVIVEKKGKQFWCRKSKSDQLLINCHNSIQVWDLNVKKMKKSLFGFVLCMIKLSDSSRLVCGSYKDIHIWSLETYYQTRVLSGHSSYVRTIAQINSESIISGSDDKTLKVIFLINGHFGWASLP